MPGRRAEPGSRRTAGKAHVRGPPGVPGRCPGRPERIPSSAARPAMWTGAPGRAGSGESASGTTTGGARKDARRSGISSRRQIPDACAGTGAAALRRSRLRLRPTGSWAFATFITSAWLQAGRPAISAWVVAVLPVPRRTPGPLPGVVLRPAGPKGKPRSACRTVPGRRRGRPDPAGFTAACDDRTCGCERLGLRAAERPTAARGQYAVQRRRDAGCAPRPRHVSQFRCRYRAQRGLFRT